jgi:multidrug efflux pump subunit AcrB
MDQSVGVRESISGLQLAALLGAGLAGLVVLLFLGSLRLTAIIVLAIPLAVLTAIFGLYFSGDSINAMTLGGLALAIGILVDQSIVVVENITRHVRMGKPPHEAAITGTREVAMPILVSTITFAVVFFPVVFLSGLARFLSHRWPSPPASPSSLPTSSRSRWYPLTAPGCSNPSLQRRTRQAVRAACSPACWGPYSNYAT